MTQTASFNNLNQLTNLSGQALSYDANGNLLADGSRNCSWDAENRLIGITYPGQSGKATAFTYDGLGRRTTITSTPGHRLARCQRQQLSGHQCPEPGSSQGRLLALFGLGPIPDESP